MKVQLPYYIAVCDCIITKFPTIDKLLPHAYVANPAKKTEMGFSFTYYSISVHTSTQMNSKFANIEVVTVDEKM